MLLRRLICTMKCDKINTMGDFFVVFDVIDMINYRATHLRSMPIIVNVCYRHILKSFIASFDQPKRLYQFIDIPVTYGLRAKVFFCLFGRSCLCCTIREQSFSFFCHFSIVSIVCTFACCIRSTHTHTHNTITPQIEVKPREEKEEATGVNNIQARAQTYTFKFR